MVPFSFKSELSYSRMMNGNTSSYLVAHGVGNQVLLPFPAFLLSLWSFWPGRKICKKPNEIAKIQVNPTKSNQIRPLFLWDSRDEREGCEGGNSQLLSPKFWLLAPDTCQGSR